MYFSMYHHTSWGFSWAFDGGFGFIQSFLSKDSLRPVPGKSLDESWKTISMFTLFSLGPGCIGLITLSSQDLPLFLSSPVLVCHFLHGSWTYRLTPWVPRTFPSLSSLERNAGKIEVTFPANPLSPFLRLPFPMPCYRYRGLFFRKELPTGWALQQASPACLWFDWRASEKWWYQLLLFVEAWQNFCLAVPFKEAFSLCFSPSSPLVQRIGYPPVTWGVRVQFLTPGGDLFLGVLLDSLG